MKFELNEAIAILERTPELLKVFLKDLPLDWTDKNEGTDTWSPFDVIGHLIHGEKTDWIERSKIILKQGANIAFSPFDRFAQFKDSKGKTINQLLDEFQELRRLNLQELKQFNLSPSDFDLEGIHPEFGAVNLKQLLAAWVIHDLGHIAQISRVMSKNYKSEVGPWIEYLSILSK